MALKTFKLTITGDIELDRLSQPTILLGQEAADQIIIGAISLWKGNYFADEDRGVEWLDILKKLYTRSEIIRVFTEAILKVSFVDEVLDLYINVGDEDDKTKRRTAVMNYLIVADGEQITGGVEL